MDYKIYFTYQKGRCHYNIDGYDIAFHTTSEREVLIYLNNMEDMLINNLRFNSIDDLKTDRFNAIEYFSLAFPEMVKNYFIKVKEQLLIEIEDLGIKRAPSKFMALIFICNIPITEIPVTSVHSELINIYNVAISLKSATHKILTDLMPCNKVKNYTYSYKILTDEKIKSSIFMGETKVSSISNVKEKIEYVINNVYYNGFWQHNVNGYDIAFKTKSSEEVLTHLQNMEYMLENILRFSSIDELASDKFRSIEYFSLAYPEMVKNYFRQIIEELYKEIIKLQIRKTPSIFMAVSYMGNVPVSNCLRIDTSSDIYKIFVKATRFHKNATNEILDDLFCSLDKYYETYRFYTTTCGTLKYIGIKPGTNHYLWELEGYKQYIFKKNQKTIEESAEEIVHKITVIHSRVSSNLVSELIDFRCIDDIKILALYTGAYKGQIKKYIEIMVENNIKSGMKLRHCGDIEGFSNIDIFIALSKNKNRGQIYSHMANKFLYTLRAIVNGVINEYLIKQKDFFINENNFNLSEDKWTYHYKKNGRLRQKGFDFSSLKNSIAKREFKLYVKYLIKKDAKTKNTLRENKRLGYRLERYNLVRASLDYFITEKGISCFADITNLMVTEYLKDLEYNSLNNRVYKSINTVGFCIYQIKEYAKWIYKYSEKMNIKKPDANVFINVEFKGRRIAEQNEKETSIIPESVIIQIQENLHFFKPEVYKRMLICLLNSPRRFNEFQQISVGDIKPIMLNDKQIYDESGYPIYQMEVIEHKKRKNKDIDNNGLDYDRHKKVFNVNYIVAREIEKQIEDNKLLENEINKMRAASDKIHIAKVFIKKDDTMNDGYSLIDTVIFINAVNAFLKACNILDSNGKQWSFTTRQTRTTGTTIMVANGCDLDTIQNQLGHADSSTTYNYYIKLSHLLMAQENTEYIKSEFDSLFSKDRGKFDDNEIIALFNKFCIDYNKIYYNRKLLGICGLNVGQKCPFADGKNEPQDEIPCADCPSLYVGEQCKSGWEQIYHQCKEDVDVLEEFFEKNNISKDDSYKVKEYKVAYIKCIKSKHVIEAISDI